MSIFSASGDPTAPPSMRNSAQTIEGATRVNACICKDVHIYIYIHMYMTSLVASHSVLGLRHQSNVQIQVFQEGKGVFVINV
ncbi:hypothetical protein GDO81_012779 [Engystomops pustulosus]|uniref:Uncharacterized protein n=1 Tax=Engystomops pustulosus TaxID=76066 RepID=A0AAV7B0I2_ENGPU|nr:hypothetical protein GDO81_012779 [Engystomops pustulosus]